MAYLKRLIAMAILLTLCLGSISLSTQTFLGPRVFPDTRETEALVLSDDMRNFDFFIDPHNHTARSIPQGGGDGIYGAFDVISGPPIDFFIVTEINLTLWENGNETLRHELQEQIVEAQWEMILPEDGPWFLVFDNSGDTEANVRGTEYQDLTPPVITTNVENDGWYPTPCWISFAIEDEMFLLANWSIYLNGQWIEGVSYGLDSKVKGATADNFFNVSYLELPYGWFNFTINVLDTASNEGVGHVNVYIYDPTAISTPTSPTTETSNTPSPTTNGQPVFPPDLVPIIIILGGICLAVCIIVGVKYWKSLGNAETDQTEPTKKTHKDRKDYVKGSGKKRKRS